MKIVQWSLLCMLISASVMAQDVKVVGTMSQSIVPSKKAHSLMSKRIALLKVELSDKARQKLDKRAEAALKQNQKLLQMHPLADSTQLGMGSVPVLDQGGYGSCVTFANTAAVDAVLNQSDYISQLCLLQLGRYFEQYAYIPSGWNGSLGGIVLNQMSEFGLVSKAKQRDQGCGGLTEYPLVGESYGTEMSPEAYHQISEEMNPDIVGWSSILDVYNVFFDNTDMTNTLRQVKASLKAGDRLTFGVLLPDAEKGIAGAIGRHHASNDSWVLTPEIVNDIEASGDGFFPGHEMIITGYDDEAIALDDQGRPHKGLLTLRNSWGSSIGDGGDFYMSYDYFMALTIEVQRIRNVR